MKHGIEWLNFPGRKGETWNPWVGCSALGPGCGNCWAARQANRFKTRLPQYEGVVRGGKWTGRVNATQGEAFYKPLHWREPRAIFPCSMGDFFHEGADGHGFRELAWHLIYDTPQHLYLILTKRPERIPECLPSFGKKEWPWKNVWLGASVENGEHQQRIYDLLNVQAAKRFLSLEPLLGPIDLRPFIPNSDEDGQCTVCGGWFEDPHEMKHECPPACPQIHWVIVGGESGPGARPMHPNWAQGVRDQCQEAEVPFFFKQHGEWLHESQFAETDVDLDYFNAKCYESGPLKGFSRVGKKQAGRILGGETWQEFPL